MTTFTERRPRITSSPACLLRWVFTRGSAAIACEVAANADRSFDLRVVPFSAPAAAFVERFGTATSAMERHADIATRLRDAGWNTTDRLTVRQAAA